MLNDSVYVLSAKQISIQQPLSEEWMENPVVYEAPFIRAIDPCFNGYVSPIEARRMGVILKRAIATSKEALASAGLESVDAIVTGTGYGCIHDTGLFLDALCKNGEQLLKPTNFMQSTHNTISSLVAIQLKNHAYNATYAHKGISFDSALQDVWLQFRLDKIASALVGGHDETPETLFRIVRKGGVMGLDDEICSEAAVSVVVGRQADHALCKLSGIKILHQPSKRAISDALNSMLQVSNRRIDDIDFVLTGMSGNHRNDNAYKEESAFLFGNKPLLRYKHLFGENYSSSGLGFYVAAHCLNAGRVPDCLFVNPEEQKNGLVKSILLFNRSDGENYSFILLEA